jgi:hypothetical protein
MHGQVQGTGPYMHQPETALQEIQLLWAMLHSNTVSDDLAGSGHSTKWQCQAEHTLTITALAE